MRDGLPPAQSVGKLLWPEDEVQYATQAGSSRFRRRVQGQRPNTLRVSLEEFSHYFETPTASLGLVRLRATLVQSTPAGERVLAQRVFAARRAAPSADAAGGVKALAAASEAAIGELVGWVDATTR